MAQQDLLLGRSEGHEDRWYEQPAYVWAMLVGLAMNMFSGYWDLLGIPLPIDRGLVLGAIVLCLADPRVRVGSRLRWQPLHGFMLALIAWTIWSALTHSTLLTPNGFYALLDRIVVPFVIFVLAPFLFPTPGSRVLLIRMLCLIGIYLSVTAVGEIFGPTSLVFPGYIMDPNVGILFGRARGPFAAAEADGMVLAIAGFAAGILVARERGAWQLVGLVSALACTLGVVLTLTRSVWLGTLAAVGIVMLMVPALRRRIGIVAGGAVTVAVLALVLLPAAREALVERLTTQRSINDRQNTNAAAMRILEERPLDGIGWGKFIDIGTQWVRQADTYPITNVGIEVHNVVLSRAAELGIPAAAVWVACVLAGPVRNLLQRETGEMFDVKVLAVATMVVWIPPTMLSPNPYPLPNTLLWLLTGILGYHWLKPLPDDEPEEEG